MGHEQVVITVSIKISGIQPHTGFSAAVVIESHAGQQRTILKTTILLIDPQLVRFAVVGYIDIHPSIHVEVCCHHPQRWAIFTSHTRLSGHVNESTITPIAIQPVWHGGVTLGSTIVLLTGATETFQRIVETVVDIVAHIQIEPAVPIDIQERRRHAPPRVVRSSRRRDVPERAIAIIVE